MSGGDLGSWIELDIHPCHVPSNLQVPIGSQRFPKNGGAAEKVGRGLLVQNMDEVAAGLGMIRDVAGIRDDCGVKGTGV